MPDLPADYRDALIRKRQENIGRLFKHAARDFSERAMAKLRERGYDDLTFFHTALISNLDVEGTRISTLAERAEISKQAMGQIAGQLDDKGFITRVPDPNDGRASLIQFTEKGWEFLQVAYEVKQAIDADYIALLGDDGMVQLEALLRTLIAGVDPKTDT